MIFKPYPQSNHSRCPQQKLEYPGKPNQQPLQHHRQVSNQMHSCESLLLLDSPLGMSAQLIVPSALLVRQPCL